MKIRPGTSRRQSGMAVLVVIALLSIVLLYVMVNARTLHYLGRDIRLIERKQVQRLAPTQKAASTNQPAAGLPSASNPPGVHQP